MHSLAAYSYIKKKKEWTYLQWLEWEMSKFDWKAYLIGDFPPLKHDHKCDAIWIDSKGRTH